MDTKNYKNMNNNSKNICIYTSAIIFGGVVSSLLYYGVSQLSKLSKFYKLSLSSNSSSKNKTEEKSDFYHLIHGNIRFVQKLQNLHTPSHKYSPDNPQKILLLSTQSLMHVIEPGLIFDLPLHHIITVSIDENVNTNIQKIEEIVENHDIKTIVVIGLEKEEKDNQKNQLKELLNTSQYINLAVENKRIKPYWASYDTTTGYVRFHHHAF